MYLTVKGVILAREPIGEYDVKLTVLSEYEGKLMIQARGARKLKAKIARHLDLGSYTTLELTRLGETNLLIGSSGTVFLLNTQSYPHFVAQAKLLALANRVAPPASPEPEIFSVLMSGLMRIRQASVDQVSLFAAAMTTKLIKRAGWNSLEEIPT